MNVWEYGLALSNIELFARLDVPIGDGTHVAKQFGVTGWQLYRILAPGQVPTLYAFGAAPAGAPHFPYGFAVEDD